MRQLLRTIIFVILIVGVITKTELSVSTNKTNNEHNTISLNKKPIVAEFDEELVGAITQVKTSVSTNKTNDEHVSLDIKPDITKTEFPSNITGNVKWYHMFYGSIVSFVFGIFATMIYRTIRNPYLKAKSEINSDTIDVQIKIIGKIFCCHPHCTEHCERWISRFFPTRPAEMPVRAQDVELVQMPQRQEYNVYNLPPNVIESHL